jgi:hypothetical protein
MLNEGVVGALTGLDDGQSGEGATSELVVHLGGTLQQTGVEVEDVAGVREGGVSRSERGGEW